MAAKNKEIRDRFIAKIRPFKRIEPVPRLSSVYTTFNEVLLDVRYSGFLDNERYWFFIDTHRLDQWRGKQRFVECFICGDENTVVFIPDDKIFEWYEGIQPNRKGHWFQTVQPEGERLTLRIGHGRSDIDAEEYLNRLDFISPIIPRQMPRSPLISPTAQAQFEDVRAAIITEPRLKGSSLHERIVDMLLQIGGWSGYEAKGSYKVEPQSPYILDAVWLNDGEVEVAIEVHDGGNETEAKDRLKQAMRFGARKVVIVSVPNAVTRLRNVCRFEAELKNWLEIWSINRIYRMYCNGYEFFEDFRRFRRRQRSDEIVEYI
jgi:hypothetical protein